MLLTIDYSEEVFKEAVEKKAGVVVAYHPPWFKSCKHLTLESDEKVLLQLDCIGNVYIQSPHGSIHDINYCRAWMPSMEEVHAFVSVFSK